MNQKRGEAILSILFKSGQTAFICETCRLYDVCPIRDNMDCPLKAAEKLLDRKKGDKIYENASK